MPPSGCLQNPGVVKIGTLPVSTLRTPLSGSPVGFGVVAVCAGPVGPWGFFCVSASGRLLGLTAVLDATGVTAALVVGVAVAGALGAATVCTGAVALGIASPPCARVLLDLTNTTARMAATTAAPTPTKRPERLLR